jgi:hypothetical protein
MGGTGSGRWGLHYKKDAVEDGLKLTVSNLKQKLDFALEGGDESFAWGQVQWSRGADVTDSISYKVENRHGTLLVHLSYTTTRGWEKTKTDNDYAVAVTYSVPPFGGRRWWWMCPLVKNGRACKRRVSKLYLPPGSNFFGCRHCHELTYRSCQESHQYDAMYASLALSMRDKYPLMDGARVKQLLEQAFKRRRH